MFSDERRQLILKMLNENGRVLAKDLASKFEMSIDSIRRDLSIMEEQGLLKRTHGGAIPIKNVRNMPQPRSIRYGEGSVYQNAIAKLAVTFIKENQTVFIGGAAIHYVMLKYLPKDFAYTVVTNSVEVAYYLRDLENVQLYLIGGFVKSSGNITDHLANEFVRQFTFDLCFATAGALSSKGLSTATPEVSIFHKTVFDNSRMIIALIEHIKFGVDMFSRMYPLDKLNKIITDEETTEENINLIKSQGTEILVAKSEFNLL
ncbi:DeoR/GlpR family DNA-binding transcription regulator [Bacillus sp. FJAT-27245]|uniref:DeoR/GlpR family DNA-binding transcription regulator n=1 Tax=Bacillus sp. FJAT-27245 TaxID=1684144 RepID=UPI0006A7907F|nr:DeoR/GlpR family DNA-binding transcription regulator [Bacillus sp. FJAT-27245]